MRLQSSTHNKHTHTRSQNILPTCGSLCQVNSCSALCINAMMVEIQPRAQVIRAFSFQVNIYSLNEVAGDCVTGGDLNTLPRHHHHLVKTKIQRVLRLMRNSVTLTGPWVTAAEYGLP